MKIKKGEEKKEEERGLARREELPWTAEPLGDLERYFDRFFGEFDRGFPEFRGRFWSPRWGPRWWDRGGALATKIPAADLKDTGKEFVLRAEMPGVSKADVDITVHSDSVEIRAQRESGREEEHEGYFYREIGKKSYYRRVPLPEDVEAEKAEGKLENGVLELTLPKLKPTEIKTHKVKIQ